MLEDIGTSNFRMSFKAALQTDKKNEERKKLIQYLKGIADEIDDAPKEAYKYIGFVGSVHSIKNIIENDRKYYYNLKNPYGISIYTQYSEEEKVVNAAEKATEQEERQRKTEAMSEMEALENRAYECRMDFVKSVYSPNPLIVNSLVAEALLKEKYMWGEGINSTIYSELTGQAYDTVNRNELKANKTEYNAVTMLYLAYATLEKPSKTCRNYAGYTHSITMDVLYEHLEDLGYDVSDEERAMLNGTHELYTRI